MKKATGRPSNQVNKQPAAKAGWRVFPEILAELVLIQDISLDIHMEIANEIDVDMLFYRSLPSTRCLLDIHVHVQHIPRC